MTIGKSALIRSREISACHECHLGESLDVVALVSGVRWKRGKLHPVLWPSAIGPDRI